MKINIALFLSALASSAPAGAASSPWHQTEGGRIRLVTQGAPDAEGNLQGALVVDLKPGWKTYWRDPGGAGVPPSIDVSASLNVTAAEMRYPAPAWHRDPYSTWAGYDRPVALPVTFQVVPGAPPRIHADVFLGVCETICIPVQTRLTVVPAGGVDGQDEAIVRAALAALPAPSSPGFRVESAAGDSGSFTVSAHVEGGFKTADLFVAGADGYVLGTPQAFAQAGMTLFSIPILERPASPPQGEGLPYTLVTNVGAVSGVVPYP